MALQGEASGKLCAPTHSDSDPPEGSSGRRQSSAVRGGGTEHLGAAGRCVRARGAGRGEPLPPAVEHRPRPHVASRAERERSGAAEERPAAPSARSAEPAGCGPAPRPPGPARGWGKLPAERRPPRLPSGAAPGPGGDYAEMAVPTGGGNKESLPLKPGQWSPGSSPGSGRRGLARSPGGQVPGGARAARRAGGGRRGGRSDPPRGGRAGPAGGGLRDAPGPGPLRLLRVCGERLRGEAGWRALPEPSPLPPGRAEPWGWGLWQPAPLLCACSRGWSHADVGGNGGEGREGPLAAVTPSGPSV